MFLKELSIRFRTQPSPHQLPQRKLQIQLRRALEVLGHDIGEVPQGEVAEHLVAAAVGPGKGELVLEVRVARDGQVEPLDVPEGRDGALGAECRD